MKISYKSLNTSNTDYKSRTDSLNEADRRFQVLAGVSTLAFPIFLLVGFMLHPDFLSFQIVETADQLAHNFHHQSIFHIGHLIVALAIPFIIFHVVYVMMSSKGDGRKLTFFGGVIAIFGAVVLGLDKGSLCLVLSGFDTLSEAQFQEMTPYLQVLVDKKGLLVIDWLIILLPVGTIIQAMGLKKEKIFSKYQTASVTIGLLLLNNPDIEIISSVGVLLFMIGYIPLGLSYLKGESRFIKSKEMIILE